MNNPHNIIKKHRYLSLWLYIYLIIEDNHDDIRDVHERATEAYWRHIEEQQNGMVG